VIYINIQPTIKSTLFTKNYILIRLHCIFNLIFCTIVVMGLYSFPLDLKSEDWKQ